jgi:hypothetical protein
MTVKESSDLIVLGKLTPATIFAPGGVNDILEKIASEARKTPVDISTKSGRESCAALAYKVARSKTALDKMGKELGETHYKSWKAITAERSRIETELDALRDEVRKPLTDWENAEKARLAGHEAALAEIEGMGKFDTPPSADDIKYRLDALICLPPREWHEFAKRAADLEQSVIAALNGQYDEASKREAEAAELARLCAEQIAREQKERDERIAAEAAERARLEAEARAKREAEEVAARAEAERQRVERERAAAVARSEQAEAARVAAALKAERDAREAAEAAERRQTAAIEAERQRIADLAAADAAEARRREADKKHRAKINNEVLAALVSKGASDEVGRAIITAIALGEVPHIKISY